MQPPAPLGADPPRYLPAVPFPPYRHLPGHTPHPQTHPQGHSFGLPAPDLPPLTADHWPHNPAYLRGIDLYNHAYWWEAHESWEALWRQAAPPCDQFLQALIQTAAALLKWHLGNRRGKRLLLDKAIAKLTPIAHSHADYMGLNIPAFLATLQNFDSLDLPPLSAIPPQAVPLIIVPLPHSPL